MQEDTMSVVQHTLIPAGHAQLHRNLYSLFYFCATSSKLHGMCCSNRLAIHMCCRKAACKNVSMSLCTVRMRSYAAAPTHEMCPRWGLYVVRQSSNKQFASGICWLDAVEHRPDRLTRRSHRLCREASSCKSFWFGLDSHSYPHVACS